MAIVVQCCLSIDDFNQVSLACQNVSPHWTQLAKHLNIDRAIVEGINKQGGGQDTVWCLDELIVAWLRQPSPTQPKPSWRILCDAVFNIDRPLSEKIWTNHNCGCNLCRGVRPVATAVWQVDVATAAKNLSDLFDDLLDFLTTEIRRIVVSKLRLCINKFFRREEELNDETGRHLLKIEDCPTSDAVLNYFVLHNFIGYINYSLIKVFQGVAKSPLLDKRIEEYEKDYQCFLELSLSQIHDGFQQCPDLHPDYPAGIPNYTIHLQSEWNGKSMFSLKGYLKQFFYNRDCIDQLMIAKISRGGGGIIKNVSKEQISDNLDIDHSASLIASQGLQDVAIEKYIYFIHSNERTINWKNRDDIIIHIPAGAVPHGTQSTITITPVPVKDCMIPKDLYLVSDVFEVTSQCKFLKPVTLKLRHCVTLSEKSDGDTIHQLTFVKAESTSEKFERLKGGEFAVEGSKSESSKYGILSRYSYCLLGVCIGRLLDVLLCRVRCNMRILRNRTLSNPNCRHHHISVIVTKDLNSISEQALESFQPSCDLLNTPTIFRLRDNEVKITNEDSEYEVHKCWDVKPAIADRDEISKYDIFEYDGSSTPPHLNFYFENQCACPRPPCAFRFEGLYEGTMTHSFFMVPFSRTSSPKTHKSPLQEIGPPQDAELLDILSSIPVTTQLQTFCIILGLSSARCSEIFDDPTIRGDFNTQRLRVLRLWCEVKERTWGDFVKALDITGYHQKAKELAEKYNVQF